MAAWRSSAAIGLLILAVGAYTAWTRYRAYCDVERDYEETQARIEAALPADDGIQPTRQEPDLTGRLVVVLEPLDGSVGIRVGEAAWTVPLPPDGQGDETEDAWFEEHWEPAIREVVEVLGRRTEESGASILALRVPSPTSPEALPPTLVVHLLAAAMEAGIYDVEFLRAWTRDDAAADHR